VTITFDLETLLIHMTLLLIVVNYEVSFESLNACRRNALDKIYIQEGHGGPDSLTRNNCFSVLEYQYILILNLSIEYV
jgi:hypothetical protein